MEVLTSKQMEQADGYTINNIGIPSAVLMENAAYSIYEEFSKLNLENPKVCIITGAGNNAGDGFALARILYNKGYDVEVVATVESEKYTKDTKINHDILKHYPINIINCFDRQIDFNGYDVIFDAIFGTGLNRPLDNKFIDIVKSVNFSRALVIAVDIPSGLSGSSHNIIGESITADYTITFCRPKIPHIFYPAKKRCGKVIVKDISIPDAVMHRMEQFIYLITKDNINNIRKREPDSHKGNYGHSVIIGGSDGKAGAVVLAAKTCIRGGSGLTTVVIPESLKIIFHTLLPEGMSLPANSDKELNGLPSDTLLNFIANKSCLSIGPGIGTGDGTKQFVRGIIEASSIPVVLDADGINCIDVEFLSKFEYRVVLTPHIGEFARLCGKSNEEIISDKIELAKNFALQYKLFLVLKSADTIIVSPDGLIYVFNEGDPSLAKGGSGDCLTGLITAFISQRYTILDACCMAVYILGKSAAALSNKYNENCILATDVIDNIWMIMNEISGIN